MDKESRSPIPTWSRSNQLGSGQSLVKNLMLTEAKTNQPQRNQAEAQVRSLGQKIRIFFKVEVVPNTWQVQKPLADWEKHIVNDDPEAPMTFYTLRRLKPDTYYELEVQAENDIGWSQPTPGFVFLTASGQSCCASVCARAWPRRGGGVHVLLLCHCERERNPHLCARVCEPRLHLFGPDIALPFVVHSLHCLESPVLFELLCQKKARASVMCVCVCVRVCVCVCVNGL